MEVVVTSGMRVVEAMLEEDRIELCGPKHARRRDREMVRGGTVNGEVALGGRRVSIRRPRVRRVEGGEVALPTYEWFSKNDPLTKRAVEQMVIGVATRKYARSLEPLPAPVTERGTSKSAVSRRFVARTQAEIDAWQARPLGDLDIVALMIDGIEFADHMLVVALGIDSSGKKHPLGIREGTTENAGLCKSLLADIVARGVPADRALLVVIDGGKGLRSAVRQVFDDYAVVQRCQVHKKRNVLDHLPDHLRAQVSAAMSEAYATPSSKTAIGLLERLATSLQKAHPGAASSLREGLEETVTVLDLGLGKALRRTLATTNPIESMFSTVRRVSQRVTRWEDGTMVLRWALAGIQEAERKFRRLMGKADMPKLVAALRRIDRERHSKNGAVVKRGQRAAG
jgi:transposase-like protein